MIAVSCSFESEWKWRGFSIIFIFSRFNRMTVGYNDIRWKKVTLFLPGCCRRDYRRRRRRSDRPPACVWRRNNNNNMFQTVDRDLPIVHYARLEVDPRCRRFMCLYSVYYNTSVNFISLRINTLLCRSVFMRIYFIFIETRQLQRPPARFSSLYNKYTPGCVLYCEFRFVLFLILLFSKLSRRPATVCRRQAYSGMCVCVAP